MSCLRRKSDLVGNWTTVSLATVLTVVCLMLPGWALLEPGEWYYALQYEGRTVGYSHIKAHRVIASEEEPLLRFLTNTVIRISDRGRQTERRYQTIEVLREKNLEFLYAKSTVIQDGLLEMFETTRKDDRMLSHAVVAAVELDTFDMPWTEQDVVVDDLSVLNWMILSARKSDLAAPMAMRAFVPRERERVNLEIRPAGIRKLQDNVSCRVLEARIQDQLAIAWIDQKSGLLLRLEVPQQGYVIERSSPAVMEEDAAIEILEDLLVRSPLPPENIPVLSALSVNLSARIYGERLTEKDLNDERQSFSGTVTEYQIEGKFEVRPARYRGETAPNLGVEPPQELMRFVQPEVGIESADPTLVKTAQEIVEGAKNQWEAAVRCAYWVSRHIRSDLLVQGSALTGYLTRQAASGTRAKLVAALCRAAGIPARQAGGVMVGGALRDTFIPHYWCEVYMADAGWVPLDPFHQRFNWVDPTYIRFVYLGGIHRVERIEVIGAEYNEEALMPLLSFSPDNASNLVEGKYEFLVNDVAIGISRTRSLGQVELNGESTYAFSLETELDSTPVGKDYVIQSTARLYLNRNGLPVYYAYQEKVNGEVREATCEFPGNGGICRWRSDRKSLEMDIPRSGESFILDRNMMGAWAILAMRLPRAVGESIPVHAIVPCQPGHLAAAFNSTGTARTEDANGETLYYLYESVPMGETLWIREDGTLLRLENPRLGLSIRRVEA